MRHILFLIVCTFSLLSGTGSYGNNSTKTTEIFTTANGLPDNTINDIQKDKEGYLWIATNKGIARFDGKNFIVFSKKTHSLFFDDDVVNAIRIDNTSIYLVSKKYGVKILNRISLKITNFIQSPVSTLFVKNNTQFVLFTDGRLSKYKQLKRQQSLFLKDLQPSDFIVFKNSLYILTQNKGILESTIEQLKIKQVIPADFVYMYGRLLISKKLGLIYATGNKVYVLKNNHFIQHPLLKGKTGITNYFENEKSIPHYIARSKNVFAYENHTFVNHKTNELKNLEIRKIFFINSNCYYLATNQGLIRLTSSKQFIVTLDDNPITESDSFGNKLIRIRRKIIPTDSKTMFLLGHPQIVIAKNGILNNVPSENLSMYDSTLMNGKIYCTTDSYGVISFDIHSQKTERILLNGIPQTEFFFVIEKSENQNLLLGGTNKIVVYNTKTKQTTTTSLPELTVYSIIQDKDIYWIGTNKGLRCAKFKAGRFNWLNVPPFYTKAIRNITLDPTRKKIWLGTEEDGILIVDPIRFTYTQKKTQILKNIAGIINDQKGHIWVSTFSGIVVFDLTTNSQYELTQKNGLSNIEYNYKSAALLPDGKVIFGGLNSYDIINFNQLKKIKSNSTTIHITGIIKNKTISQENSHFENYTQQESLTFDTGKEDLTILLSDLDISSSSSSFFNYQINDDKPVLAYNNRIRISNLAYGDYTLKIKMYDNFGNLKNTKQLTIKAVVPFYYNLNFYIIIFILFLVFGSITIYNIRKAQRTEKITKERIAMDLHDEVGTILTRMLFITTHKKIVLSQNEKIKQGISEALFSVRTSINALSNSNTSLENLLAEIQELLKKGFNNSTINYTIHHSKEIPAITLKPELFRDCKLILFEATTNALKYSNAQQFSIDVHFDEQLVISILDNGELTNIKSIYNKGNGIGNIVKRTERNKGTCSFGINGLHGLKIKLIFDWSQVS